MKKCRIILYCLLILLLVSGAAAAGSDTSPAGAPLRPAGESTGSPVNQAPWYLPEGVRNLHAFVAWADSRDAPLPGPAGTGLEAGSGLALAGPELEKAKLDDESLGQVSGGAALFARPDVINRGLFAVLLWDEGKTKRGAQDSVCYDQGNGQISSSISSQRR